MERGISLTNDLAVIAHDGHRFSGPKHSHEQAQLLYAVSGVVSVTTEEGTWVTPPSWAVWLPPGLEHQTSSRADVQFRSLLIDPAGFSGLPERCQVVAVTPLVRELILKLADLAEYPASPQHTEAVIALLLMELSFQPAQPLNLPTPKHPDLARLCERFRADLAGSLSVEEAATALNMSRATFMRLFKRETGLSFGHWRQQARMLSALTLLAEGSSILEVAYECGYNSPSAFSATFRRSLGCSPSSYFSAKR